MSGFKGSCSDTKLGDKVAYGKRVWSLSYTLVILLLLCGRNDATDPHPPKGRLGNEMAGA